MAIERYVVLAAALNSEASESSRKPVATFYSETLRDSFDVSLDQSPKPGPAHWPSYVEGVIADFLDRGSNIPAFKAVIQSSVPLGGGLSSSAALEVATATLLEAILGTALDPKEKSLLCQRAEQRFTGVPCGIMDQFSSVFGQKNALMLLDCRSQQIQSIPFTSPEVTLLIANSCVKHKLAGGEYAERRRQCETAARELGATSLREVTLAQLDAASAQISDLSLRRARHVVTENERTIQAANAICEKQWAATGELMFASHESLRDDFEVSCDELDLLVELARAIGLRGGVYGSRMTGGGFGGCTVSLVRADSIAAITETIRSRYLEKTGIEACIFTSRPARGAHQIRG